MIDHPGIEKINRETLADAVSRIVQAVQPEQILLFGSQAWGQPTQDSELEETRAYQERVTKGQRIGETRGMAQAVSAS